MKNNKLFNLFIATTTLSIASLSISYSSLTQTAPEAIEIESITVRGILRDFHSSHPDFERNPGDVSDDGSVFEFGLDTAITTDFLGEDGKPVYTGGSNSTTTEENFNQWFNDVESVNQSMDYSITLADEDGDGTYTFAKDLNEAESFFPLDGKLFGNEDYSHNYHFTYELDAIPFTYNPGTEENPRIFTFQGDDDVFVYINGQKVIDIGGVHAQREQSVNLDELGLIEGETYELKLFFAERHIVQSNFRIDTNIKIESPQIALFAD